MCVICLCNVNVLDVNVIFVECATIYWNGFDSLNENNCHIKKWKNQDETNIHERKNQQEKPIWKEEKKYTSFCYAYGASLENIELLWQTHKICLP